MLLEIKDIRERWSWTDSLRITLAKALKKTHISVCKRLVEEENHCITLRDFGYRTKPTADTFLVTHRNWQRLSEVTIRKFTSDYDVFEQIFIKKEFKTLFEWIPNPESVKTIIDAGANIGIAVARFRLQFPNAVTYCIEPETGNFQVLQTNLSANKIPAVAIQSALWSTSKTLYIDRSFGDGREWAVAVSDVPTAETTVPAISVNELVKVHNLSRIDLLKIDIEGSENEIFSAKGQILDFLNITRYIAIELHGLPSQKQHIVDVLTEYGFSLGESGEYVIGKNQNLSD